MALSLYALVMLSPQDTLEAASTRKWVHALHLPDHREKFQTERRLNCLVTVMRLPPTDASKSQSHHARFLRALLDICWRPRDLHREVSCSLKTFIQHKLNIRVQLSSSFLCYCTDLRPPSDRCPRKKCKDLGQEEVSYTISTLDARWPQVENGKAYLTPAATAFDDQSIIFRTGHCGWHSTSCVSHLGQDTYTTAVIPAGFEIIAISMSVNIGISFSINTKRAHYLGSYGGHQYMINASDPQISTLKIQPFFDPTRGMVASGLTRIIRSPMSVR